MNEPIIRYFIGFMVTLGLIILLIILLFSGGGGKPKTVVTPKTLNSYANTDADVRLTIDGPIIANQNHQQIQIDVSNTQVTFEHILGYDGDVLSTQAFGNTENSYDNFLHAINLAGFTKGNTPASLSDERGYCALGDRYVFELMQNGKDIERYWTTSCGKPKTFTGNTALTITLFQDQVPGYDTLTQNITL